MLIPEAAVAAAFPDATEVAWKSNGANGDVYLVRRPAGVRAVKVVQPAVPPARLARELDGLQAVNSPYVVPYRGHGEIAHEGQTYPYLEMDWIEGRSLEDALDEVRGWDLPRRIELLAQICEGVDALGTAQVVHRDLKLANIILTPDDRPVIVDLGWARLIDAASITESWRGTGTPAYNSPEQLRHEKVGTRSDLFSVGIIAYFLVTGRYAFEPRNANESLVDLLVAGTPAVSLLAEPAMTEELAVVVERLVAASPAQRPRRGQIAAEELRAGLGAGRPPLAILPRPVFLPFLGSQKRYLRSGFFNAVNGDGLVGHLRLNVANYITDDLAVAAGLNVLVDPASQFSRLARTAAPHGYQTHDLPESFTPADLADPAKVVDFVDRFFEVEKAAGATILVSPYFDCGEHDLVELDASLHLAEVAHARADRPMLAGVSVHRAHLANDALRPAVLDRLTALEVDGFYILINDGMTDYRQLDERALLLGLKDLTQTLRQNRQAAFFGRVGTVGLCLVVAGAAGFSCGFEAKNLHYTPNAPMQKGGAPVARYYESQLLSFIRYTQSRAARARIDAVTGLPPLANCSCQFCTSANLMAAGPWDDDTSRRHQMLSLTNDVRALALLRDDQRRAWLDARLAAAVTTRAALAQTGPQLNGDSATPRYQVWRELFVGPAPAP